MVLPMLQDEDAILFQQLLLEDEVWYALQFWQGVRRIGKDEVKLHVASLQILEDVCVQHQAVGGFYLAHHLVDELVVVSVFLDAHHLVAPSREQFQADTSRSCKEVEGSDAFAEVHEVRQHIEQILFRKVGRRTSLERAWHVEMPAFV